MAHGIMENDNMFSANGIRPWHGLGTIVDNCLTSEEAIRVSGLGWDVIQEPVFLSDGTQIDNLFANIRSDTRTVLGAVKGRYNISQNKEAFSFLDGIISNTQGVEARFETAGSLFNGKKVFMLVRLPDNNLVGDKIENYLFLSNSHDGSTGLMCGLTNVRVVCNNTLQMAESGAKRIWKVRHCASLQSKVNEAAVSLGLAIDYMDRISEDAEKMARQKISEEKFFKTFFEKLNICEKNKEKVVLELRDIYTDKDDLQNFRGTAWGMYNAVADFVSNSKPLRTTEKTASWKMYEFMNGYPMLELAQGILKAA